MVEFIIFGFNLNYYFFVDNFTDLNFIR